MSKSLLSKMRSPYLAIIPLRGVILDDFHQMGGSGGAISAESVAELVGDLVKDDLLIGTLLHINSPGGLVTASESLYDSISLLKEKGPVFTFIESIGASGGYMAALASDHIVATPTSLTGSVGVRLSLTNYYDLASRYGVKEHLLTTGSQKGAGSPLQPFTNEDEAYFRELIDYSAQRFYGMVRENRPTISDEDFATITSARVFTADKALALGVIDEIGKMKAAKDSLKAIARMMNPHLSADDIVWRNKEPKSPSTFSRVLQMLEQTNVSPIAQVHRMLGAGRYDHAELSGRAWAIHE